MKYYTVPVYKNYCSSLRLYINMTIIKTFCDAVLDKLFAGYSWFLTDSKKGMSLFKPSQLQLKTGTKCPRFCILLFLCMLSSLNWVSFEVRGSSCILLTLIPFNSCIRCLFTPQICGFRWWCNSDWSYVPPACCLWGERHSILLRALKGSKSTSNCNKDGNLFFLPASLLINVIMCQFEMYWVSNYCWPDAPSTPLSF